MTDENTADLTVDKRRGNIDGGVAGVAGHIFHRRHHKKPVNKSLSPMSPVSPPENINLNY